MTTTHILGIDPGLSGAFCLLQVSTKQIVQIWDMPVKDGRVDPEGVALIVDLARGTAAGCGNGTHSQLRAAVENVSSFPRQAGAFNFGRSAGVVHGVLGALGVPMDLISPNIWKGAMGLRRLTNETQEQNKSRARALAIKLWPENAELFKRVKDDGRAEAALITRPCRFKNEGELMSLLCQRTLPIEGKPSASTYCMRPLFHTGPCNPEPLPEDRKN